MQQSCYFLSSAAVNVDLYNHAFIQYINIFEELIPRINFGCGIGIYKDLTFSDSLPLATKPPSLKCNHYGVITL